MKTSWCFVVRRVTPGEAGLAVVEVVEEEGSDGGALEAGSSGYTSVGRSRSACWFQRSRTRGSQDR